MAWDRHSSNIPRKKRELHSRIKGFINVVNILLNPIFSKDDASKVTKKDLTGKEGLVAWPSLSNIMGDEASLCLMYLKCQPSSSSIL